MGRKPKPKLEEPEQSKRFIETADEVGADDERFLERTFKIAAKTKRETKQTRD
jgi:hypothetical protein